RGVEDAPLEAFVEGVVGHDVTGVTDLVAEQIDAGAQDLQRRVHASDLDFAPGAAQAQEGVAAVNGVVALAVEIDVAFDLGDAAQVLVEVVVGAEAEIAGVAGDVQRAVLGGAAGTVVQIAAGQMRLTVDFHVGSECGSRGQTEQGPRNNQLLHGCLFHSYCYSTPGARPGTDCGPGSAKTAVKQSLFCIGEEQLLTAQLIACDGLLSIARDQPVMPLLGQVVLKVRVALWIDQHAAVLVEQCLVAFEQDFVV